MQRARINLIVDIFLAITFLVTIITSLGLFFRITFANISWIHILGGMFFIILGVIHFLLHCKWYIAMLKKKPEHQQ